MQARAAFGYGQDQAAESIPLHRSCHVSLTESNKAFRNTSNSYLLQARHERCCSAKILAHKVGPEPCLPSRSVNEVASNEELPFAFAFN